MIHHQQQLHTSVWGLMFAKPNAVSISDPRPPTAEVSSAKQFCFPHRLIFLLFTLLVFQAKTSKIEHK